MNRQVEQLARALDDLGEQLPAWDDATGPADISADKIIDQALQPAPGGLGALGEAVNSRRRRLLYRLSVRAASRATSTGDPGRCKAALGAAIIAESKEGDWRDLMVNLAPHRVAATRVTGNAQPLFDWAADQAGTANAETLRTFGTRTDVTLEAFAWKEVTNSSGTWFVLNW